MAQYVLVEFDNNDEADGFVNTLLDGATVRIAGVFKKPTMFCECVVPDSNVTKSVLGQKNSWRVCANCLRPRKGVWQNPRNIFFPDERLAARQLMINVREPRIDYVPK